jgi:STE24 endopeptidase
MPYAIVIALVFAFGLDLELERGPLSHREMIQRIGEMVGAVALVAMVSFLLGRFIAFRVRRTGQPSSGMRRLLIWGARGVEFLSLGAYFWTLFDVGWARVVEWGFGFRGFVLIDEILILAPFLLMQIAGWWGLYAGERALRFSTTSNGLLRHVVLRARQTLGITLPVALVYALGHDLIRTRLPVYANDPWARLAGMGAMGALVLVLAPAFVRLTWPTRSMPAGPLRDRLEHLARRLRFRYTDILVWDTGGTVVNAGVTGAIPWYRYVLITDGMAEGLGEREIEAVFGHEVGHIAHRHLVFFAFFFLGSMGVVALASWCLDRWLPDSSIIWSWVGNAGATNIVREVSLLLPIAAYFLLVFGAVSRRFERQADVFGCRAVSCGLGECPPHADVNAAESEVKPAAKLCPVGIRIFANALTNVALLNGIDPNARSWRHGSIRRRINFVEGLEARPEVERRFQAGLIRFRVALTALLVAAVVVAAALGALSKLG